MTRKFRYSLRIRLMILLTGAMGLLWLGSAVLAFRHAVEEADMLFDVQLVQAGELLLGVVRDTGMERVVGEIREQGGGFRLPMFYLLMDLHEGRWRVLARSPGALAEASIPEHAADGFMRTEQGGESWRIYLKSDEGVGGRRFRVAVAQRYRIRAHLAHEFAEHLAIPLALAFPLMALAIWWAVSRAMRPVHEAADKVVGMPVDRLQPIALAVPCPTEIAPLIEAIDALTRRVAGVIASERRFTADAAHELRTPLAALKVQAQVAMRVEEPVARDRAMAQVLRGVERMTHLVEQLLSLARLDPAAAAPSDRPADLADAAAQACADLAPRAIARRQDVHLRAPTATWVRIDPHWAEAMIRNLVDNALRYGRDGGRVDVDVGTEGGMVVVRVCDDGPGVPPPERGRLLERFYRGGDGSAGTEGCGLGLSIVSRIVESAGGRIEFIDGLGRADGGFGFGVRVQLPTTRPERAASPRSGRPAEFPAQSAGSGRSQPWA